MEVITSKVIQIYLRSYLNTLSGNELLYIHEKLVESDNLENLPWDMRDHLHLQDYLLTRNIVEIIRKEFERLLPDRCLQLRLVDDEQTEWICKRIWNLQKTYLDNWKNGVTTEDGETEELEVPETITSSVREYSTYLFGNILKTWHADVKISPKLADDGLVTLLVEQPVIFLSKCKDQLLKWIKILQGHLGWIHFLAKEALFVDCSLENSNWHGINILVISNKIECLPGNHVWDVSSHSSSNNGGNLTMICKEFVNMSSLKIVSNNSNQNGSTGSREDEMRMLLSLFPPWENSDTLRKLVFENAMKLEGTRTHLLYEPKEAYNHETGEVTGTLTDFYVTGETNSGLKYHVGFMKKWTTKNAFCLIQANYAPTSRSQGPGKPGTVTFASPGSPVQIISAEALGIQVVAVKQESSSMEKKEGYDAGYLQINAKEVIHYPPGRYELKQEDKEVPMSVQSRLLGKYLRLSKRIELERMTIIETKSKSSAPSTASRESNNLDNKGNLSIDFAAKLYGDLVHKRENDGVDEIVQLVGKHQAEWWTRKILNLHVEINNN